MMFEILLNEIDNMQNHRLSTFKSNARDTTHRLSRAATH